MNCARCLESRHAGFYLQPAGMESRCSPQRSVLQKPLASVSRPRVARPGPCKCMPAVVRGAAPAVPRGATSALLACTCVSAPQAHDPAAFPRAWRFLTSKSKFSFIQASLTSLIILLAHSRSRRIFFFFFFCIHIARPTYVSAELSKLLLTLLLMLFSPDAAA